MNYKFVIAILLLSFTASTRVFRVETTDSLLQDKQTQFSETQGNQLGGQFGSLVGQQWGTQVGQFGSQGAQQWGTQVGQFGSQGGQQWGAQVGQFGSQGAQQGKQGGQDRQLLSRGQSSNLRAF